MSIVIDSPQLDLVFNALGHKKRRGMINSLAFRPATITQLANEYDLSLPAVHKHIRALEAAQLIKRRKVGRTNFVALNKTSLHLAQKWLAQYRTEWGNDEASLENYIAGLRE